MRCYRCESDMKQFTYEIIFKENNKLGGGGGHLEL